MGGAVVEEINCRGYPHVFSLKYNDLNQSHPIGPGPLFRARAQGPIGVMIARGDLAAEIGFERLVEVQKEILRICVAASVSGEMTDAAMASRAECGLNKGPAIGAAIELLDRLLSRIDTHVFKKTARLRALKSW